MKPIVYAPYLSQEVHTEFNDVLEKICLAENLEANR